MPAASVCSHTTSPYHTIGGRTDGKRCTESHDNSLVFGHNDLKNQSNLLKKYHKDYNTGGARVEWMSPSRVLTNGQDTEKAT